MPRLVAAFDKFRGSATAAELGQAALEAGSRLGWDVTLVPLADGGEGSLDVIGGPNKLTEVQDPLRRPIRAGWRLEGSTAYIEMAAASGLVLAGGAEGNDPLVADTTGTGQLVSTAIELGATKVVVFLGGSATTDGGLGALRAMPPPARLKGIELIIACDVETRFVDAATVFGPQKGASPAQVKMLTRRLERLEQVYADEHGVDVSSIVGGGAAGGLAGGLVAVGGVIRSGFTVLAERADLDLALEGADLAVTGEGFLDAESFHGKVVGGVHQWATAAEVPVAAVVGDREPEITIPDDLSVVALADRYGLAASLADPLSLVTESIEELLRSRS